MPTNATRNLTADEVDIFLGSGLFVSLGPERCLVAWGHQKKSKTPANEAVEFFLPDFYLESKAPWVSFENVTTTPTSEFVKVLQGFAKQPRIDMRMTPPDIKDFEKQFQMIQESIRKKEINKAVPVLFERTNCSVTKAMRAHAIHHLLSENRPVTAYGYMNPTNGMIGATPEFLFSYDSKTNTMRSMALAGTRKSELEKINSLEKDEKEIYEHALVVKGLREKLSNLGDWQVSPTYVWDIGLLSHLRTDITVELNNKPDIESLFQELCVLLHPTAALGVSPIQVDFRYLKKCDGQIERGRFGAPFGVLSRQGRSLALVAIRNIQWNEDGEVRIGSGCGVIEKSELKNEWAELALKRRSVRELLGL